MKKLLVLALGLLVLSGCPREKRALDASRKAVEAAAELVHLVDVEVALEYKLVAEATLAECDTSSCYDEKMGKWNKTVFAVAQMKSSLHVVELALDSWEAGSPNGRDNLRSAAACFLDTLTQLQVLLSDVGAKTSTLTHGLSFARDLFDLEGGACPVGVTP